MVEYNWDQSTVHGELHTQKRVEVEPRVDEYAVAVVPMFGAWAFTASAIPSLASGVVALSALAGAVSYLFYYRGISKIGAARAMALNISYSAWAVVFAFVLQGTVPTMASLLCCVVILVGTILAACDWNELFTRKD